MRSLWSAVVLGMLLAIAGCHAEPRRDPSAASMVVAPRRPARTLPSLAGFRLGAEFVGQVHRCPGYELDGAGTSATCTHPPETVSYPIQSVFLRRCGRDLCQITVRVELDGVAQLNRMLGDVVPAWWRQYGDSHGPMLTDISPSCVQEVARDDFACLLRDRGTFLQTWELPSRFDVQSGSQAQLYTEGSEAAARVLVRLTLATPAGIEAARRRDL